MYLFQSKLNSGSWSWRIAANIACMALFLSPVPTFLQILKIKHTGSFSAFTYVCSFVNCVLWTFYGMPSVTDGNMQVISLNGAGMVLQSIYVLIFLIYAPERERVRVMVMKLLSLASTGIIIACTLKLVARNDRAVIIRPICVVLNTLTYGAPLSVVKQVMMAKSVNGMPFLLSFFSLVDPLVSLVYGVLHQIDRSIMIPNGLGVLFGIIQMIFYALYHKAEACRAQADYDSNNETI